MERSSILRWVIIAVAVWLAWTYLPRLWGGGAHGHSAVQPLGAESVCAADMPCVPPQRSPEAFCELQGNRFRAVLSSQGATLKHLYLEGAHYTDAAGKPIDLVTTPDVEQRRPLRFDWRAYAPAAGEGREQYDKTAQVPYDVLDWQLVQNDGKSCSFRFADERVELSRTVRASQRPFELEVEATVKNLSPERRKHQLAIEAVAWRFEKEVESKFGRQSPFVTTVACAHDTKTQRMSITDFEPSDFSEPGYSRGWFVQPGRIDYAAVSNFYFSQALVPQEPQASSCQLQIEERWAGADKTQDPNHGAMYRSRLTYEPRELGQNESASYKMLAFMGPKERDILATAAGGSHHLSDLVDLGYFSFIAKYLLLFLVWLHAHVGNWGLAIILMTIVVRTLLFPLTWKSIQSGFAMRKLKPEIDAINLKYKDDPQQKNIATMELWKKHKVNPVGGCLPAIVQLPVWWALYTSLQTAVELYHTPFLWFRDLSAPDPFYVLPIVLGATMIVQQRMMPTQLDPAQQKMMTYIMPAVFTFMMLFLPAGLGVYMLTNSLLGILQQLAVEKYWARSGVPAVAGSGITVRDLDKPSIGGKKTDGTV